MSSQDPRSEKTQVTFNLMASAPKDRSVKTMAGATLGSLVFHAFVLAGAVWASATLGKRAVEKVAEQVSLIRIQEEKIPEPPPPPPPPEKTPPPMVEVPKGFQVLAAPTVIPPDIPPPSAKGFETREADFTGEGVEGGRSWGNEKITKVTAENVEAAPTFTPYTVRPELKNREEVRRALVRFYPAMLKDAGIGGTTYLWILLDEKGFVMKTQVQKTSGYPQLDDAALKVGDMMEFSPGLNRDVAVKVWIQIPIVFKTTGN
jgi:TonB family protein